MNFSLQLASESATEVRPRFPLGLPQRAQVFPIHENLTPAPREQINQIKATSGKKKTVKLKNAARQMILDHFDAWYSVDGHHYKTKKMALISYCRLYQAKVLDIPKDVYSRVKKLSVPSVYRWQKELAKAAESDLPLLDQRNSALGGFVMPFKTKLTSIQQTIVLGYFLRQGKLKTATIHKYLLKSGYGENVTYAAVNRFLQKFNEYNRDLVVLARDGETSFYNKVQGFVERDWSLLKPDELWIADGHRLDIAFRDPKTGKMRRATMVAFLDGCSRRLVGFSLHWTETTDSVQQALAMGLHLSGTPKYILFDNGTGFKNHRMLGQEIDTVRLKGALDYVDIKPIWSIPGNPRSKPIERFFGTLKDQFSRVWETFTGGAPHWKPEQLEKLVQKGQLPELGMMFPFLAQYLDDYNNSPHAGLPYNYSASRHYTPNEVYYSVDHKRYALDDLKVFMRKAFAVMATRNGFKVAGRYYFNAEYVPKLVGNAKKYIIYINDFKGESVDVHDDKDRYLFTAWPHVKLSPLEQLSNTTHKLISEEMHKHGISLKNAKSTLADIVELFPPEAEIQNLIMASEAKELEAQEAINSLPVAESLEEDGHEVDSMYDDEYEKLNLDD